MKPSLLVVAGSIALLVSCVGGETTPVGVTLDDGQVLIGDITTPDLILMGAFGEVAVPLEDIGMVIPVEGRTLADSSGQVTVWLRNGSELKGEWADPELAIGIEVGGRQVEVELPTDRMQAVQLRGQENWPEDGLYRVRTTWGDDFLVDPTATRIVVENELGVFDPFLTECQSVAPIGDPAGDWRIELETGTVLIGPIQTERMVFALPLGPETIEVAPADLVALVRGAWIEGTPTATGGFFGSPAPPMELKAMETQRPVRKRLAEPGLSSSQGWFDARGYEDVK